MWFYALSVRSASFLLASALNSARYTGASPWPAVNRLEGDPNYNWDGHPPRFPMTEPGDVTWFRDQSQVVSNLLSNWTLFMSVKLTTQYILVS